MKKVDPAFQQHLLATMMGPIAQPCPIHVGIETKIRPCYLCSNLGYLDRGRQAERVIKIPINEKMIALARKLDSRVQETRTLRETRSYTSLEVKDRYYYGYLGELVFLKFLRNNHIKNTYEPKTDGKSDSGDFVLYNKSDQPIVVDVKTASKSFHTRLMMPDSKYQKETFDYIIGVKLNGDVGEIWGYCNKEGFSLAEDGFDDNRVPTRYKDLTDLEGIDRLLPKLKQDVTTRV